MRRYWYAAAAAAIAMFTILMTGTASASHAVLTYDSVDGTAVAVDDTLTGSGTATFFSTTSGSTGITCDATFTADVASNPSAPGTATEDNVTLDFNDCTENIFGVTGVVSVTSDNEPYEATANSSFEVTITEGSAGPIAATVVLNTLFGQITCKYESDTGTVEGDADNSDNSITITNSRFNRTSGPSLCFSAAYFSVTFVPVTGPGGDVYTN